MKKLLALILVLAMMMVFFAGCAAESTTPPADDGQDTEQGADADTGDDTEEMPEATEGTAQGHNGELKVSVTFDGDMISAIEVTEHVETAGIADPALEGIPAAIIDAQSLDVDSIAGATVTSAAIIEAVKSAAMAAGVTLVVAEDVAIEAGEDVAADVVVVGAGLAGVMATYELKNQNPDLNVILLEKSGAMGGALPYTGGAIVSPTSQLHVQDGVESTLADFVDHLNVSSVDADLNSGVIEAVFDRADETFDLFIQNGWTVNRYSKSNPTNDKIYAYWIEGAGSEFNNFLGDFASTHSIEPLYNSKATELVVEDGAVKGVMVEDDTSSYKIMADAVILATGGFAANDDLVMEFIPNIPSNYLMTVHATATGDGFTMVEQFDAPVIGSGTMGTLKTADNQNPIPMDIIVDEDGLRFTDETQVNYWVQRDFLDIGKENAYYISGTVADRAETLSKAVESGAAMMYDTVEDLAAAYDIDLAALQASIDSFDGEMVAPYYVSEVVFRSFGTLASLEVDQNMAIIDGAGNAIPGLYGAGELVVANAFTTRYPGGGFGISFAANSGSYVGMKVAEMIG